MMILSPDTLLGKICSNGLCHNTRASANETFSLLYDNSWLWFNSAISVILLMPLIS